MRQRSQHVQLTRGQFVAPVHSEFEGEEKSKFQEECKAEDI